VTVAGDVNWDNWEGRAINLIDDDIISITHSPNSVVPGAAITLDLGKKAKLSRFILHQRQDFVGAVYAYGNYHTFEVYSSDAENNPSGDWSTWTLRKICTVIKPSGASFGTTTDEDILAATQGHDFSLPLDMPPVRYIRLKVLSIWDPVYTFAYAAEITAYGFYVE
jgi:hypothetical protein